MEHNTPRARAQHGGVKGILIGLIVVVLAGGLGYIFVTSKNSQTSNPVVATTDTTGQTTDTMTPPPTIPPTTPVTTPTPTPTQMSVYKNGTYSAVGNYISPGGHQTVNVTLTLSNDVVTDATVTEGAIDGTSRRYQGMFISGYKQYVIGKKINTISLDVVSGSSLTPGGFNDALTKIEAQAKV